MAERAGLLNTEAVTKTPAPAVAERLIPVATETRAHAVILGAASLVLLAIPPLTANGQQILHWGDLIALALAIAAVVWLRRQRRGYEGVSAAPASAVLVSDRSVLRSRAAWGATYVLFVLLVVAGTPDFFGFGFACAVITAGLWMDSRHLAHCEERWEGRLYRTKQGWSKPRFYLAPHAGPEAPTLGT
jgi:hypothetical protein